ncbi:hypothetical protein [Paraburkholderia lycopersici]|uniref:Uncharacterized protein n=1 Tax=Paraburkholderia lycopersici TaxID=416944 RepID=A0A1G6Z2A7_9BURK|nr:hypothetical protein [Paraburkholderia lycopersici]SDD96779.1 hypothetical protein SAMN05421548_12957 [Paraburkholderia lycopersici]
MDKPVPLKVEVLANSLSEAARLAESLGVALRGAANSVEVLQAVKGGLLAMVVPSAIAPLLQSIGLWRTTHRAAAVTVENAGRRIEITGASTEELQALLEALLHGEPGQAPSRLPRPPDADQD